MIYEGSLIFLGIPHELDKMMYTFFFKILKAIFSIFALLAHEYLALKELKRNHGSTSLMISILKH